MVSMPMAALTEVGGRWLAFMTVQGGALPFDVARVLATRSGENFALHERYMNHQLARTLRTLGFDRNYVRGEGCYLYDDADNRYLDFLSGFGVYALGRSHPAIKAALHQAIDLDLPNMIQMDCALLPGLLAEQLTAKAHAGIGRAFFCNSGAGRALAEPGRGGLHRRAHPGQGCVLRGFGVLAGSPGSMSQARHPAGVRR